MYRWVLSPLLKSFGVECRFEPTCSQYAQLAIQKHGFIKGIYLGTKRLFRCHPLCEGGHDPVPDAVTVLGRCETWTKKQF